MSSFEIIADLSIPLRFGGPQPNAFGVDAAMARTLGDTRTGSSVNFESLTFIPHCNGTHTECVGHITDERVSVRDCLRDVVMPAVLITVKPEVEGEPMISRRELELALRARTAVPGDGVPKALIVRTMPNDESKVTRRYDGDNIPPYFSAESMEHIVECGFEHLVCDLPSVDRMFDEGKLVCHRIFWNIETGSREINARSRTASTITELAYIPDSVHDGEYMLNLQIAPFDSDAAPSRPLLLRLT